MIRALLLALLILLPAPVEARPNIVLFFVDDLGWGDIGWNGNDLIATPNIDSLGRDGVSMPQFYTAANVCTPSRAALLTGRYPMRSGMQHVIFPHSQNGLPAGEVTLAELLNGAGYATGMIGKWHLGHRPQYWPTAQGFESFLGVAYSNDMVPFDLYRDAAVVDEGVDQTALSDLFATEGERLIARWAQTPDRPFFLYYAPVAPHIPLFVPPASAGRSRAGLYGDVVETLDDEVGRTLATLERAGIADDTIVIFTSDNGPWFQGDNGPWRGRKGETYDGGFRVPMLVRWPNRIPAGSTASAMAMTIDLLPTLAGLASASIPTDRVIDGRDIAPMWLTGADTPHDRLYFFDGNDLAAIRDRRFKLQLRDFYRTFEVPFEAYATPLLFDLQIDPRERYDVGARHPAELAKLRNEAAMLRQIFAEFAHDPITPVPPKDTPRGPQL